MESSEIGYTIGKSLQFLIPLSLGIYYGLKKVKGGKNGIKKDNSDYCKE